jgi:hypothetical protein
VCCNFVATCLVATFYHNDQFLNSKASEISGILSFITDFGTECPLHACPSLSYRGNDYIFEDVIAVQVKGEAVILTPQLFTRIIHPNLTYSE